MSIRSSLCLGVILMPKGKDEPSCDKKEERDLLPRVVYLAPLIAVILQFLELLLRILGVIR